MAIFWPETTKVYCFLKVHTKHADPRDATREDLLRACEKEDIMATPHIAELKSGRHDARQAEALAVVRASAAELRAEKAEALLTEAMGVTHCHGDTGACAIIGELRSRIRDHLAEVDK